MAAQQPHTRAPVRRFDLAVEAHADADDDTEVPNTYNKLGPYPGMQGPGITRIDIVLVNRRALAMVSSFAQRYDLKNPQHVLQEVRFDQSLFYAEATVTKTTR